MSGVTVHGPYKHRNRWRLHVKEGGRTIACPSYSSRKKAEEARAGYLELTGPDQLWAEVAQLEEQAAEARARAEAANSAPLTVGELSERYVMYLRDHKQRRPSTVRTTRDQLRGLLKPVADLPATAVTRDRAKKLYRERATEVAAATHHGNLRQARSLWRWAIKQRLVRVNVWLDIEPIGTPSEGKEQLHPTAAERLFRYALEQAGRPVPRDRRRRNYPRGAAAVLCMLIFGVRPSEIVGWTPWDLDGGLLRIRKGKTRKSRRWLRIPAEVWSVLQAHVMEARAEGRERVFPFRRDWVRQQVKRLCRELGIPEVCAYGLRGTHASLATEIGATAEMVARQLGHEGTAVTRKHYIDPAASIEAAAARVFSELTGGDRKVQPEVHTAGHRGQLDRPDQLPKKRHRPVRRTPSGTESSNSEGLLGCEGGDSNPHRLPH